jgi:hypothetical protein
VLLAARCDADDLDAGALEVDRMKDFRPDAALLAFQDLALVLLEPIL